MNDYENNYRCNVCDTLGPNSRDVWINEDDCKIQLDIQLEKHTSTIIWGYIFDNANCLLKNVTVTLLRYGNSCNPESVCSTRSDSCGYYQFEVPYSCKGKYKVVASSSSFMGNKISNKTNSCNTFEEPERCFKGKCNRNIEQNNICYS